MGSFHEGNVLTAIDGKPKHSFAPCGQTTVGGDYLSVSADAHRQLLDYLAAHRAAIWITAFSEAMAHVSAPGR